MNPLIKKLIAKLPEKNVFKPGTGFIGLTSLEIGENNYRAKVIKKLPEMLEVIKKEWGDTAWGYVVKAMREESACKDDLLALFNEK